MLRCRRAARVWRARGYFISDPAARWGSSGPDESEEDGPASSECSTAGSPREGLALHMRRRFTQDEVDAFVWLTGDFNSLHSDVRTGARREQDAVGRPAKIVPGLLLASTFPAIIGSTYPGAVYASQTLRFRAPCEVGRDVVAEVSVVRRVGRTARFATRCYAWDGQARGPVLVEGEAMAVLPEA